MNKKNIQAFIRHQAMVVIKNVQNGVYNSDKAMGHLAGLTNLAAEIRDFELMQHIAFLMDGKTIQEARSKELAHQQAVGIQ